MVNGQGKSVCKLSTVVSAVMMLILTLMWEIPFC